MTVEMVAMLVASAIQGQVVAVYNTEKQDVCHQHQEQEAPEGAPSPQADSLHQTVNTLELWDKKAPFSSGFPSGRTALQTLCSHTGISSYSVIYCSLLTCTLTCTFVCVCVSTPLDMCLFFSVILH